MKSRSILSLTLLVFGLSACAPNIQTGQGGSMISGSAGDAGAQGANSSLVHCSEMLGTVALEENPQGYGYIQFLAASGVHLPRSPLPLLKLMLQQTGCFRIVDRSRGLNSIVREQQLQEAGMVRKQKNVTKGNIVEAHYTLIPDLAFSNENAGGSGTNLAGAVLGSFVPYAGVAIGALVGNMKFKEAQVVLSLVDNNTSEQISAAEGSAKATDYGADGSLFAGFLGGGAGGWTNTAESKVVAAAFVDAINKIVPQFRSMAGTAADVPEKKRR